MIMVIWTNEPDGVSNIPISNPNKEPKHVFSILENFTDISTFQKKHDTKFCSFVSYQVPISE